VTISVKRSIFALCSLAVLGGALWVFGTYPELKEVDQRPPVTGDVADLWFGDDGALMVVFRADSHLQLLRYADPLTLTQPSVSSVAEEQCTPDRGELAFSFSRDGKQLITACGTDVRWSLLREHKGPNSFLDETATVAETLGISVNRTVVDVGFVDDSRIVLLYENGTVELRTRGTLESGRKLGEIRKGTRLWQQGTTLLALGNPERKLAYSIEMSANGVTNTKPFPLPSTPTAMVAEPEWDVVVGDDGGFVYFLDPESTAILQRSRAIYPAPIRAIARLPGNGGLLVGGDFSGIYQLRSELGEPRQAVNSSKNVRLLAVSDRFVVYGTETGFAVVRYEIGRRINQVGMNLITLYTILLALVALVLIEPRDTGKA